MSVSMTNNEVHVWCVYEVRGENEKVLATFGGPDGSENYRLAELGYRYALWCGEWRGMDEYPGFRMAVN